MRSAGMIWGNLKVPRSIWDLTGIDRSGWAPGKILKFDANGNLIIGTSSGGIGLTDLSAASPLNYNNATGQFSMAADAYAPFNTVSFPGFGSSHYLAAYGDHTHDYSGSFAALVHNHTGYEPAITKGTTAQYFRGDMSLATFPTSLPASDVSSWAKAATKPGYSYAEVGAAASGHAHDYSSLFAVKSSEGKVMVDGAQMGVLSSGYFSYLDGLIYPNIVSSVIEGSGASISSGAVFAGLQGKAASTHSHNYANVNGDYTKDFLVANLIFGNAWNSDWMIQGGSGTLAFFYQGNVVLTINSSGQINANSFYKN